MGLVTDRVKTLTFVKTHSHFEKIGEAQDFVLLTDDRGAHHVLDLAQTPTMNIA